MVIVVVAVVAVFIIVEEVTFVVAIAVVVAVVVVVVVIIVVVAIAAVIGGCTGDSVLFLCRCSLAGHSEGSAVDGPGTGDVAATGVSTLRVLCVHSLFRSTDIGVLLSFGSESN